MLRATFTSNDNECVSDCNFSFISFLNKDLFFQDIFVSFCWLCEQMANLGVGSRMREGVDCVFWVMRKGDEREFAFHHKIKT